MTTLAEMRDWVYSITARPDLITETTNEIIKATIKEHAANTYKRDLAITAPIALTAADSFRYSVDLSELNIRKIGTVMEYLQSFADNPAYLSFEGYSGQIKFEPRKLEDKFDNFRVERSNVYYHYGTTLDLVAYRQVENIVIVYYAKPSISVDSYSSWIADDYPYVIAEHAAVNIFQMTGRFDEAKLYSSKLFDNRLDILKSEVDAHG